MIHLHMPSTSIHNDATVFDSGSNGALREEDEGEMEVEASLSTQSQFPSHSETMRPLPAPFKAQVPASTARVQPDGMLLYVAEASYEPGTSPLSSWVPIYLDPTAHGTNVEVHSSARYYSLGRRRGLVGDIPKVRFLRRCLFLLTSH